MRSRLFFCVVAFLGACAAPPEKATLDATPRAPVETRSTVDRAVATTGDIITYTVTLDYDPAYEVDLPEPGAEIAGFRITDVGSEEPRDVGGRRVEQRWYKLRADLVGSYVLPPVNVTYRPVDAEEGTEPATLETSEIFIEVESVLAAAEGDVTDIRGLKPLHEVERPLPWWYAAGGGGVVLLALIAFLLWRQGRQEAAVPPRPPHEVAFEALERLRQTDFEDVEAMRLFHFEISEVVRAYVEGRFTLNATDLTTEEIVGHLHELRGVDRESRERLRRFLNATDQVKFAAYVPGDQEIEETYENALTFVETTRERSLEEQASAATQRMTAPVEPEEKAA